MDSSKSATSGCGKTAGGRSKTPGIPVSTRLQRNQAEKERRDKLNGFITELATLVPMVSNASKPLDKVSILRLAAAEMRLHFSCLNPKKYKKKPLVLPPAIISSLDLIERTTGGFIMVTTLTGLIVFCSRSIEDYLGYQNIDVMGNKVVKYIYEDDIKYFESQVNSVVKSLRKAHKKTKVIKAHMLQKPLPRSSETCRPRNMIFKISVHQNDTSENGSNNNGSNNLSSNIEKTRPQKDFGYSAVVLMFIEPVRFEPEIDITYIDSNQDVYFTRHGLQGEIIYADQRISTITGYMPHDVQGTSAYQYICSSDVPIALFAQKAMFTSPDGKGVIVYRLRIRDMRCIYLQSSGQIAYKESSNEISHFVCFNRLLSEDEGSQELKKFQQRYAPQIMEAKMLQVKQNPGSTSPTTDLAFEQVLNLINNSPGADIASTSAQANSFTCSTISSPEACPDLNHKPNEAVVSPPCLQMEPDFIHSTEGHSTSTPIKNGQSNSVTLNCTPPTFVSEEHIDAILERPEQRLGGGPLRRTDSSCASSSPYKIVINDRNGKVLASEQCRNGVNQLNPALVNEKFRHSVNSLGKSETYQTPQNRQFVSIKSQNRTVHFVNVNNNLINGTNLNGTAEVHDNQSMVYDPTLPQKLTFQLAPTAPTFNGQHYDVMAEASELLSEYMRPKEQVLRNNSELTGLIEADPNVLYDELNFNEVQNPGNHISRIQDKSDISQMYNNTSSLSSLLKTSSVPDLHTSVNYSHNLNSYPEIDSYNYHLPTSINSFSNGATVSVYNGVDNLNFKPFNSSEMNGYHEAITSFDDLKTISPMETFDSVQTPVLMTAVSDVPQKTIQNKIDFTDFNTSGTLNTKTMTNVNQNGTLSAFSTNNGHDFAASLDWSEILANPAVNEEVPLNKELYSELETFFMGMADNPLENSTYSQNSISSENKTIYHQ